MTFECEPQSFGATILWGLTGFFFKGGVPPLSWTGSFLNSHCLSCQ
jgi:hypothetical protein